MRFFYFSKRSLVLASLILILSGVVCAWTCLTGNEAVSTAGAYEPIFQGNTNTKAVAITVNVDWGEEFIPTMLQEFQKANARVTFFVTGRWAEKNPELLKQMASAGHSIQNHGYKHLHFNSLSVNEVQSQIKKAEEAIFTITGQRTSFFASPYGEYNSQLVKTVNGINYQYIMWSVDTIDWQRPDPATIINRVMKKVHNDAIILMHPTEPTVKALPGLLQQLQGQNYQLVAIEHITGGTPDAAQH